jgi:CheY-like chemotaxis protein
MTTGKRALIVDDSRSARVILSRMLEQHGMAVDTAESAEQALDYLRQQRPDVIFMDHLMPGMDGFQAVQAIKADAQTATIPLMMYTSQEGELYVSQARALGAVGVLPKTVRPVDVSRVLYQLRLLPDRRQSRSALFESAPRALAAQSATAEIAMAGSQDSPAQGASTGMTGTWAVPFAELEGGIRESLQQAVRDQLAEQRRFLLATFEAFARRMSGEFREAAEKAPPAPVVEIPTPEPPRAPWWPVLLTGLLAVVPTAVFGYLLWQAAERNLGLSRELTASKSELATAKEAVASARRAELAALAAVTAAGSASAGSAAGQVTDDSKVVEYVPYGEVPLSGARLERLRALASTLQSHDFRGRILVETHTGDFCLTGSAADGYAPADAKLPSSDCAVVGNPFGDALSSAQRESLDFANFAATLRRRTDGAIQVETVDTGRRSAIPYPKQGDESTAGEWNAVAAQNNRVEFRLEPDE